MNADRSPQATPEETVTLRTAFIIMQQFLHAEWELFGRPTDSLGDLLSFSQFLQDGGTADPATFQKWLEVAGSVKRGELGPIPIRFRKET
jgi:hypothetical protein